MKIDPKATKADLVKLAQGFKNEAATARVEAARLRMELDDAIEHMGERKPEKLFAIGAVCGGVVGVLVGVLV